MKNIRLLYKSVLIVWFTIGACWVMNANGSELVKIGQWPFGLSHTLAVSNNICYLGAGGGIYIVDVTNPAVPVIIGEFRTPGRVNGLAIRGSYLYVANQEAGLRIVNVSNPVAPVEVGFVVTPDWANDVSVSGNYAYLAAATAGLRIINISSPSAPYEVAYVTLPGYAQGLTVEGNIAYVCVGYNGLFSIDISDPMNPSILSNIISGNSWAYDVVVWGNYAYVSHWDIGYHLGYLTIFDISVPTSISFVGETLLSAVAGRRLAVDYPYVYYAGVCWLSVVDVDEPTTPVEVTHILTGEGVVEDVALGDAFGGNYVYCSDSPWMRVIDKMNPANPQVVGQLEIPYYAGGIDITNNYAVLVDWLSGLIILDVTDPTNPLRVGQYKIPTKYEMLSVTTSGERAYCVHSLHQPPWGVYLDILNLSDPANPALISSCYLQEMGGGAPCVFQNYAYVPVGDYGISIVDISEMGPATVIGSVDTPGQGLGAAIRGQYLYVADGLEGLQVVNVSNPTSPTLAGQWNGTDIVYDVVIPSSSSYAYVAGGDGFYIVNLSTPTNPQIVSSVGFGGSPKRLAVSGTYAFVVTGLPPNIDVIDISNPHNPQKVAHSSIAGTELTDVSATGNLCYVSAGDLGLQIFRFIPSTAVKPALWELYP